MARALSRHYTHQIMARSGFGTIRIHRASGVTIEIGQENITKDGSIRKDVERYLDDLTRENIEQLETKGVRVYVGGVEK